MIFLNILNFKIKTGLVFRDGITGIWLLKLQPAINEKILVIYR